MKMMHGQVSIYPGILSRFDQVVHTRTHLSVSPAHRASTPRTAPVGKTPPNKSAKASTCCSMPSTPFGPVIVPPPPPRFFLPICGWSQVGCWIGAAYLATAVVAANNRAILLCIVLANGVGGGFWLPADGTSFPSNSAAAPRHRPWQLLGRCSMLERRTPCLFLMIGVWEECEGHRLRRISTIQKAVKSTPHPATCMRINRIGSSV